MREITVKIYQFDELSEKAKEKAREWYRSTCFDSDIAWEQIQDDAKEIGLNIFTLDDRRGNEGEFINSAIKTCELILKNHGKTRRTYKTALKYKDSLKDVNEKRHEEACHNFLYDLLEDYCLIFEREIDFLYLDAQVDESILINEYTFTIEGKREG